MTEVEIKRGKLFLPDHFIEKVEEHKQFMLAAHASDDKIYSVLCAADFETWMMDYIAKYC